MTQTIDALNWRYATKQYDPTKKLSAEQLAILMEATRLSPSSFGLQPYTILHITNTALREKLRTAGYDQSPITDASDFLVLTVPTNLSSAHTDAYMKRVADTRGIPFESLSGFADMINGTIAYRNTDQNTQWATHQAYIALGVLLTTAALEHIDATPMEGFAPAQFDEILGLKEQHLTSVVIVALGTRSANDTSATYPKVRLSTKELFIEK